MMWSVPATSNRMAANTARPAPLIGRSSLWPAATGTGGRMTPTATFDAGAPDPSAGAGGGRLGLGVRRAPDELAPARAPLREALLRTGALRLAVAPVGPRRGRLGQANPADKRGQRQGEPRHTRGGLALDEPEPP